jgi:hypothetical protein
VNKVPDDRFTVRVATDSLLKVAVGAGQTLMLSEVFRHRLSSALAGDFPTAGRVADVNRVPQGERVA